MSSEEVSKAPAGWPEGQGRVEVEASSPIGLPPQVVTCRTSNSSTPTVKQAIQSLPGYLATEPRGCVTFTLWTQTVHAESSDAGGAPQVEPVGSTPALIRKGRPLFFVEAPKIKLLSGEVQSRAVLDPPR